MKSPLPHKQSLVLTDISLKVHSENKCDWLKWIFTTYHLMQDERMGIEKNSSIRQLKMLLLILWILYHTLYEEQSVDVVANKGVRLKVSAFISWQLNALILIESSLRNLALSCLSWRKKFQHQIPWMLTWAVFKNQKLVNKGKLIWRMSISLLHPLFLFLPQIKISQLIRVWTCRAGDIKKSGLIALCTLLPFSVCFPLSYTCHTDSQALLSRAHTLSDRWHFNQG